jgi:transcription elongation factor Elf1
MNCGICTGRFSVNISVKPLCIPVDVKNKKIDSIIYFVCYLKLKISKK